MTDIRLVPFYYPWPNLGVKLSRQWENLRDNTEKEAPLIRAAYVDPQPVSANEPGEHDLSGWAIGERDFRNKFRIYYDKTYDRFSIQYNSGTEPVEIWNDYLSVRDVDGRVTVHGYGGLDATAGGFYTPLSRNLAVSATFSTPALEWQWTHSLNAKPILWNTFNMEDKSITPISVDVSNPNIAYFYFSTLSAGRAIAGAEHLRGSGIRITDGENGSNFTNATILNFNHSNFYLSHGLEGYPTVNSKDSGTDHGSIGGLSDDDHTQYLLASAATSRALFATNWTDLTDTGASTLHKHDHGGQDGLSDDDHTQYSLADGTRAFTGVVSGVTPTSSTHLTTKGYVDGVVGPGFYGVVFQESDGSYIERDDALVFTSSDFNVSSVASKPTVTIVDSGIDHGSIGGLSDDDHTQYSLADGTRAFTGVVSGVTPTSSTHLTTKGYVDSIIVFPGFYGVVFQESDGSYIERDDALVFTSSDFNVSSVASKPTVTIVDSGIDHGGLGGIADDDHALYLLASDATSRASFASNWVDLTDGGTSTLHSHTGAGGGFYGIVWSDSRVTKRTDRLSFNGSQFYLDGSNPTVNIRDSWFDHGGLGGLSDDDHTQYILVDGTRQFTGTLQGRLNVAASITTSNSFYGNYGEISKSIQIGDREVDAGIVGMGTGYVAASHRTLLSASAIGANDNEALHLRLHTSSLDGIQAAMITGTKNASGNRTTYTAPVADDSVLIIQGSGYAGGSYEPVSKIVFQVDTPVTNVNYLPGRIVFSTQDGTGGAMVEALRINKSAIATFAKTVIGVTPTASTHLATKGYVDGVIGPGFYGVVFQESDGSYIERDDALVFTSSDFNVSAVSGKPTVTIVDSGIDHGSIGGLSDDDHTQYLLASDATSRASFASNWLDLTDGGATSLHSHAGGGGGGGFYGIVWSDSRVTKLTDRLSFNGSQFYLDGSKPTVNIRDSWFDHGGLGGLSDDDHTQYILVDGTRKFTGTLQGALTVAASITTASGTFYGGYGAFSGNLTSSKPFIHVGDREVPDAGAVALGSGYGQAIHRTMINVSAVGSAADETVHLRLHNNSPNTTHAAMLYGTKNASGTKSVNTTPVVDEQLFIIQAGGYAGGTYSPSARIVFEVDNPIPNVNYLPGRLVFSTDPGTGGAIAEALRIDQYQIATFTKVAAGVTPTAAAHLATKGYVDGRIGPGFYGIVWSDSRVTKKTDRLSFNGAQFYLDGRNPTVNIRDSWFDHGGLGGLSDDDHALYLLASDATSRASFAANWLDLTDGGASTLHSHAGGGGIATITSGAQSFGSQTTLGFNVQNFYLSGGATTKVLNLRDETNVFTGSIPVATIENFIIVPYAQHAFTVGAVSVDCESGTATAGFYIIRQAIRTLPGQFITGLDPLAVSSTTLSVVAGTSAAHPNTLNVGDRLVFSIYTNTAAKHVTYTVKLSKT